MTENSLKLQKKQSEWNEQWTLLQDNELFLFKDWILPNTLDDFRDKEVLECGCGGGQHTSFIAPYAKSITAVDLNTAEIAKTRNKEFSNIEFVEDDIAKMDLGKKFDIVFSIGVVHHTDDPDLTFENMKNHTRPGGRTIVWVYSQEGNSLVKYGVEPVRKLFLKGMSRKSLLGLSKLITALLYIPVYSVYKLPLKFLPFYEYFDNFRKMTFERNTLNVFDKLNAPQVDFISRQRISKWFNSEDFSGVTVNPYKGVSWSGSGTRK
ncbi:MAG: class I SAM-dependent methyltransferase [Bacteroidetes bacterium]|nr:class I SAM-dependent methyltransferase [Bacteroidota bacterium]